MKSHAINLMSVTVLVVLFIVFSNSTNAQCCAKKKQMCNSSMSGKTDSSCCVLNMMKLSAEQQKSVKDLRVKMLKETMPVDNQINEKQAHIKTLSSVDKPDMNAINATVDEISALKAQKMKLMLAHKQEVRKVLNEEQKLMFDSKGCKGMGEGCCMGKPGCGKSKVRGRNW